MEAHLFWFMDIGPRDTQEDCLMFDETIMQVDHGKGHYQTMPDSFVAAVCDGLGGHDAGEVASRFFCDNLLKINPALQCSTIDEELIKMQVKSVDLIPSSCGTTLAGIKKNEDSVLVFNAGDSRVYHFSKKLSLVSHDHSYVQELVDNQFISEGEAIGHPYKNVVTFGMGPVFQNNETGRRIFFKEIIIKKGDCILICSDGVHDALGSADISKALLDDESGGDRLIRMLYKNGLRDNASFIFIWFP